jgi:hypothetical protein
MRKKHRGPGITVNPDSPNQDSPYTTTVNKFKRLLDRATDGIPLREFNPLVVKPHPRQAEIDAFNAIPSRYS